MSTGVGSMVQEHTSPRADIALPPIVIVVLTIRKGVPLQTCSKTFGRIVSNMTLTAVLGHDRSCLLLAKHRKIQNTRR